RPRRQHSRRPRRRRRPRIGRQALPHHGARRLAHHPADDRQAQFMTLLRVLSVASEIYPLIKTGGLADVAGALPVALADCGVAVKTLVPGYPDVLKAVPAAETLLEHRDFFGGPARLLGGTHQGLELL